MLLRSFGGCCCCCVKNTQVAPEPLPQHHHLAHRSGSSVTIEEHRHHIADILRRLRTLLKQQNEVERDHVTKHVYVMESLLQFQNDPYVRAQYERYLKKVLQHVNPPEQRRAALVALVEYAYFLTTTLQGDDDNESLSFPGAIYSHTSAVG